MWTCLGCIFQGQMYVQFEFLAESGGWWYRANQCKTNVWILQGVIRLKVIEAMNLENKDYNLLNKKDLSDPYCEIQGARN